MGLPIYDSASHSLPNKDYNKGLSFERFFDAYPLSPKNLAKGEVTPDSDAKKNFLQKFTGLCGDSNHLQNTALRQLALTKTLNGHAQVYGLNGHLVTGIGNSHPVENGFLWHYTLGVPYLPGSQVKGLLRSLIERYFAGNNLEKKQLLYHWFGSEDKNPGKCDRENQTGELIFFDAIPIRAPQLGIDIMTPHMGNWYAKGGEITDITKDGDKIPADWHDPTPIPFLAVHDAALLFSIAPRTKQDITIKEVFTCLDKALEYLGAGAKTATGYGAMSRADKDQEKLQNIITLRQQKQQQEYEKKQQEKAFQQSLKGKSTLVVQFLTEQQEYQWNAGRGIFVNPAQVGQESPAERWLKILEEKYNPEVFDLFKNLLNSLYPGIYENPDQTTGKGKFKFKKPRPREVAKKLKAIKEKNTNKREI